MPTSDRARLAAEGYVIGLDDPAPSVVSVTTTVSGLAVTMFLQLMTDFMGKTGEVFRLNYDVMESVVRRGRTSSLERCRCRKVRGYGDLRPRSTVV
jgi:hypothetical protein